MHRRVISWHIARWNFSWWHVKFWQILSDYIGVCLLHVWSSGMWGVAILFHNVHWDWREYFMWKIGRRRVRPETGLVTWTSSLRNIKLELGFGFGFGLWFWFWYAFWSGNHCSVTPISLKSALIAFNSFNLVLTLRILRAEGSSLLKISAQRLAPRISAKD